MLRRAGGWMAVVVLALIVAGCAGKQREADFDEGRSGELYEEALAGGTGSLEQAQAGRLDVGDAGPLEDVYFSYDSFDLDNQALRILQENASWLRATPAARIEVEGHCDERGTFEYNLALGAKRAAAAKTYLVSLGIPADRITTISYGEELPYCHEQVESCWQRNRRDHFVVLTN